MATRKEKMKVPKNDILRSVGLKVTIPRVMILERLSAEHGPFTVEEIQKGLPGRAQGKEIDVVTIYRTLAIFEQLKLVHQCDFGDGLTRYERSEPSHHHHHLICKSCKKVETLATCPVDGSSFRLPKTNYKDLSHRLEFFGICPSCQ